MLREITEEMLAAQKRGPSTVVYTFVRALLDGQWVDTTDDLEGERHTEEYVCPPYAGKDPFLMLTIRRYEDGYEPSFLIGDNLSMTGPKVDTYELAQDWLSEERLVAAVEWRTRYLHQQMLCLNIKDAWHRSRGFPPDPSWRSSQQRRPVCNQLHPPVRPAST